MREFDTLKSYSPPINVVPGSTINRDPTSTQVGSGVVGTDYTIEKDGWYAVLTDPGKLTGSSNAAGPYYEFEGAHRSFVEWVPFARDDNALIPLGQDVAEGKSFEAFHSEYAADTISGSVFPGWNGVVCRVVDIWSSEEISNLEAANLFGNGLFPGAEPAYPMDLYSALNMPIQDPANIPHKLRYDQIISARYREMISSSNAPTSQYFGGQLMTVHDSTIGGSASIADRIHHLRYVRMVASNNGTDNLDNPADGAPSTYNYAKVGFFVPASVDTLTIGIDKIASDAEWATIARRGASR
tara:strand:+ start:160 stop:1053 length:894 start_codon:yes stop_codon:yes gene_type:complete